MKERKQIQSEQAKSRRVLSSYSRNGWTICRSLHIDEPLCAPRHCERPEGVWQSIRTDCRGFGPQPRNDDRRRMPVRCLQAMAKDRSPIGMQLFEEGQYSLPSAVADGQMNSRLLHCARNNGGRDRDLTQKTEWNNLTR